jgi:hypothetical protein
MTVSIENDDRPPNTQMDSVDAFAREQALQSEQDVLEGLRNLEAAEGVRWYIYRINATDPTLNGFLDRWGTVQLTQENMRDKFGSGTYKVRGHYPNGTIAAHRTIEIAGDAPRREALKATPITPSAGEPQSITQVMLMLDERDARRRAEENARREDNASFWKGLAATLAPIVAPKLIDLVTGGNRQGTVTELLTGLKELRALDGPPGKSGASGIKETLETLALLRDTFDTGSRAGEKGPWDALTELARAAGPKVGALLEALPQLANNARPASLTNVPPGMRVTSSSLPNGVPAAPPNPLNASATASQSVFDAAVASEHPNLPNSESITSPTSETNPIQTNGEDMNLALVALIPFFRKQLELLVVKAAANSDPTLYADLLLDNLPVGVTRPMLTEFLARDDWWSVMQQFDERVIPYEGWFREFRTTLIESLRE